MKTKRTLVILRTFVLLSVLALFSALGVHAAENPLASIPTKNYIITDGVVRGTGCDYYTPAYSKKIRLTVTSSNKKVVTAKVYNFTNELDGKTQYFAGYETTRKGWGKATLTIKLKVGSRTYTRKQTVTYQKYTTPFSSFKIGNTSYLSTFKKYQYADVAKIPSGKLSYTLKKGYKMKEISALVGSSATAATPGDIKTVKLKKGQKVPKNTLNLYLVVEDSKGNTMRLGIY